jgi:hypothetical protein
VHDVFIIVRIKVIAGLVLYCLLKLVVLSHCREPRVRKAMQSSGTYRVQAIREETFTNSYLESPWPFVRFVLYLFICYNQGI